MKKWFALLLCVALMLATVPYVAGYAEEAVSAEGGYDAEMLIIENADFETTAKDSTPGWALLSGVIMPSGELAITEAEGHGGSHSLSITPISTFTDTKTSVVYSGGVLGIRDGMTYTASAYFKGDIVPSIGLRFYNMYSVEVTTATVKATGTATDDWTYLEVSGTVPSGALFARVMLEAYGDGTLFVDDVAIEEEPLLDGETSRASVEALREYLLTADCVTDGTVSLQYYSGETLLSEHTANGVAGQTATVRAFAPKGATTAKVTMADDAFEKVELRPLAYGTQVPDSSFESVAVGNNSPWQLEQSGSGKWELGSSADLCSMENYVSGDITALRLTTYAPGPSGTTVSFYSAPIAVTAGETYAYSIKVRTSKTDLAYAYVYLMYYSSTSVADRISYSSVKQRANINWGTLSTSMEAPENATYARLCVQIPKHSWWTGDGYDDSRWVDIDDAVVTHGEEVVFEDDFTEEVNGTNASLSAADTTTNFVTDGNAGVTMGAGRLVSGAIPVLQGKEYTASVDIQSSVINSVAFITEYYNMNGVAIRSYNTTNVTAGTPETLQVTQVAPDNAVYMKLVLLVTTGETSLDNAGVYAVSDGVSNFSFEQVNAYAGSGNFPMQWRATGDVDAYAASSPSNAMPNRTMGLNVMCYGSGSVYSSMMKATADESYMVRIQASSVQGGGLRLAFFDSTFAKVGVGELTVFDGHPWARYTAAAKAPANTAYVAFELVAEAGDCFCVDVAEFSTQVLYVTDDTQMFVDDYVLGSTTGLERVFHEGVDAGTVLTKDDSDAGPWGKNGPYVYGSVFFDEDEQLFKMWYLEHNLVDASSYGGISWYTCYATSPDGVNWTRPNLGLVEYGGNTDNNIVNTVHLASVFKQSLEDEPDDAKRYIMIYQDFELLSANGGSAPTYSYAYSADGIHWGDGTTFTPGWDVITAGWDDDNKQFITLQKVNIHGRRDQHFMTGTPDEWSVPLDAIALADIQDTLETYRADSYGTGFYVKDGNYFALDWLLSIPGGADTNVTHVMDGTKDIRLGYSRDLTEDWQRPTTAPIVENGEVGSMRYSLNTVAYAIDVGDEIWLYSSGCNTDHGGQLVWDSVNQQYTTYYGNRATEIFITKWRADGFVSLNAGEETGVMTTKRLVFSGDKLILNADASAGAVRVELLDENGNVLSGYGQADCDVINTNSVDHVVSWNGNANLSALQGSVVTVRVYAENSEIYSFKFTDETLEDGAQPTPPKTETVLEYEAVEMVSVSTTGYVRFGNVASAYELFMTSDGANYDQTYGTSGSKDAIIHRFTAPQDGTLYIDTAFTTDGTADDMGIRSGNADWHADYPAKYAIADKNGTIVFPRDGNPGTVSYGQPAGIPQSDPVTVEVKAGDTIDFILMDTYGGGIPMFFEARIFMNAVSEETYVGGPSGALNGTNFNEQGEDGWQYMYAAAVELVTRVIGDINDSSTIDVCDAVYLAIRLAEEPPEYDYAYDLYEDAVFDQNDVNALRKYLLKLVDSLRITP